MITWVNSINFKKNNIAIATCLEGADFRNLKSWPCHANKIKATHP